MERDDNQNLVFNSLQGLFFNNIFWEQRGSLNINCEVHNECSFRVSNLLQSLLQVTQLL